MGGGDAISVVEAGYQLGGTETEWLQSVADAFQGVLGADMGLLGYHIDAAEDGLRFSAIVQSHTQDDYLASMRSIAALHDKRRSGTADSIELAMCAVYDRMFRHALSEPADHMLHSEWRVAAPKRAFTLGAKVHDVFTLVASHVDGHGATCLMGAHEVPRAFPRAERQLYQRLGAHIISGLRLRRRLGAAGPIEVPSDGAVIEPRGAVSAASGAASEPGARQALGAATRLMDRARTRRLGRGAEAVAIWQGLVDGSWSLIERFDSDGRRLILAHRNPANVADPRALTEQERWVLALVVRGYSNKLVGYTLGIAEGTVAAHLHAILRKLGCTNRQELVQLFAAAVEDDGELDG